LMGDAGGELAEGRQFSGLYELLLLVAQFFFAPLDLGGGLPQVSHDVNHRFAGGLETQLVLVGVLQDMQHGPSRIVEPIRLAGQSSSVLLIVGQDMEHGLSLVGEAFVGLVQIAHDVEHRAALLIAFPQAALQRLHLRTKSALGRRGHRVLRHDGRRCHQDLRPFSLPSSFRELSSSFSRAIILSSRPTTTSSNFSRSRIFSCSSVLDFSRSRTTCSYSRMSRRMPIAPMALPSGSRRAEALSVVGMPSPLALRGLSRAFSSSRMSRRMPIAPMTLPSGSRRAEALSVVGITSPLALRGLSRALRVTPRSTTSRRAAVNSRVSWGLMKRESDCSSTSSWRKPRSWETASLAWRIFPSRSETKTGSGAFLMRLSA